MKKSPVSLFRILLMIVVLAAGLYVCGPQITPAPATTPAPPVRYSLPELKYLLFSRFDVFWCDPYSYPIGRPGQEQKDAPEQFRLIKADEAEFAAILRHLNLASKADFTEEEQLLIFREHRRLNVAVQVTSSGNIFNFTLREGEGQGSRYEGTITPSGEIIILKKETSFNTCPICLTQGTLIDTPAGQVPVEQLRKDMTVWSRDSSGNRVEAVVTATVMTPVPPQFEAVRVILDDGRTVYASPGHPGAEGRPLGDYKPGENLDSAIVLGVERFLYTGGMTYDLLPSGSTGLYWANGILLKSTLAAN